MHLVLAAEACEFFRGNMKRHCFVHRRSCLKTFERANVRQYRTIQSKVTHFRGLCKSLKSLRRLTLASAAALRAISCMPMIMIEVSPSAYPGGLLALGTAIDRRGGDLLRFSTNPHPFDCSIPWHARSL